MKRILSLFIFFFIFGAVSFAEDGKGILWKISGNNLSQASYLFGTIHTDRPEVLNLPAKVKKIFNQSESFSAEVNLDLTTIMKVSQLMMLPEQQSLKSLLDKSVYQKSIAIAGALGIPEFMLNRMRPWAVAVTISMPKQESQLVLDMKLYMDAQQSGKRVYGLESIEEQLSAFQTMSIENQIAMLNETLAQHHLFEDMFKELLTAYLNRDLAELQSLDKKYQSKSNQELESYLRKELLEKRNIRMYERMQERLEEGNAFIAVGALHLPGEQGLINLLRRQNFTVTPVY